MWDKIPKIYCICTLERDDRYQECLDEFSSINILNYEFYRPNKIENGSLGCFRSHMNVIKKIIDNDYEYALILEDDFTFINNDKLDSNISKCITFLNGHSNEEILIKLGGINLKKYYKPNEFLHVSKSVLTHSYFINLNFAKTIYCNYLDDITNDNKLLNENVDVYLANKYKSFYILQNISCIQRTSLSDNIWTNLMSVHDITNTTWWPYIQRKKSLRFIFGKFIFWYYF